MKRYYFFSTSDRYEDQSSTSVEGMYEAENNFNNLSNYVCTELYLIDFSMLMIVQSYGECLPLNSDMMQNKTFHRHRNVALDM